MRKLIAPFAAVALLAFVGCKDMNHDDDTHHDNMNNNSSMKSTSTEPKKMSTDACSHCEGVQTATADGKCPKCGMKAENMMK